MPGSTRPPSIPGVGWAVKYGLVNHGSWMGLDGFEWVYIYILYIYIYIDMHKYIYIYTYVYQWV